MRYVPLREAEPGMVLAADLYDSVGRTLIGCHCELTESYLEKLEAYGFDGIYIEDKLSEGITIESVITPQLRQEVWFWIQRKQETHRLRVVSIQSAQ